jgi:7-carboxy-7-deazaguanine synthase
MSNNNMLPIMEAFYTIQGEGFHTGKAAYFIRIAGCNVGCTWCDVKESWNAEDHPLQSIEQIVSAAEKHPARIAVITGGEPLQYDCSALCAALHARGFKTHLETSGAYPLSGTWDWICLSPKKFKAPLDEVLAACDEFKPVIFHASDIKWAENFVSLIKKKDAKLYLQPEWSKQDTLLSAIIDYIKENPKWQMSLQTHKYMNIP